MEHREMRVLWDWTIPLANLPQAANTTQRPTPVNGGGELEKDEVAEVVLVEIFPPVTVLGVAEDLAQVVPILDGTEYGDYVSLSGRDDSLMTPPLISAVGGQVYSFGKPMSSNPLQNTTLKFKDTLTFTFLCGAGGPITQQYGCRAWGYVYKETELARDFGVMDFSQAVITDAARNRVLRLAKPAIMVSRSNWLTLPGGKNQAVPRINPLIRFARNDLATDGVQGEYALRFGNNNTLWEEENMYWELDAQEAILVEGLGMRAPVNLAWTYLDIGGNVHPKGRVANAYGFPTQQFNNERHFGRMAPFLPANIPLYRPVPKLDRPLLIWNEKGLVAIRDAGVAVAIGGAVAAITGIKLDMK